MAEVPYSCSACNMRWPMHQNGCPKQDNPLICPSCHTPMYVSYAAQKARHFETESQVCPPKRVKEPA